MVATAPSVNRDHTCDEGGGGVGTFPGIDASKAVGR